MSDQEFSDDGMDEYKGISPVPSSATNEQLSESKRQARAQHNALERRRRDNIKDMYCSLKDEIPNFTNDRSSRAQILKKAIETIEISQEEMAELNAEIAKLEEVNTEMRHQIVATEQSREGQQLKKSIGGQQEQNHQRN